MMERRAFVTSVLAAGLVTPLVAAEGQDHSPVEGPLANASVSFGNWRTEPPLDRFPNVSDRTRNGHQLIPHEATIKAGGTVNFVIGGFHHVLVYAPGTQPTDINVGLTTPVTAPPGPPLINDPANRVYRGLDPSLLPQDRVEVVQFSTPGTYLVICGVLPHFVDDNMYGFVKVLP
jgi:plastocyanin